MAFVVIDQVLSNAEPGTVVEKGEPGGDPALLEVGLGVVEQEPADRHDGNNGNDLE
ncbi:hypothetical protein D3C80_1729940 [compost metagenome]